MDPGGCASCLQQRKANCSTVKKRVQSFAHRFLYCKGFQTQYGFGELLMHFIHPLFNTFQSRNDLMPHASHKCLNHLHRRSHSFSCLLSILIYLLFFFFFPFLPEGYSLNRSQEHSPISTQPLNSYSLMFKGSSPIKRDTSFFSTPPSPGLRQTVNPNLQHNIFKKERVQGC